MKVADSESADDLQKLLEKVQLDRQKNILQLEKSLAIKDWIAAKNDVITLRYFASLENSIKAKRANIDIIM